jgi:hypothetical protein
VKMASYTTGQSAFIVKTFFSCKSVVKYTSITEKISVFLKLLQETV